MNRASLVKDEAQTFALMPAVKRWHNHVQGRLQRLAQRLGRQLKRWLQPLSAHCGAAQVPLSARNGGGAPEPYS